MNTHKIPAVVRRLATVLALGLGMVLVPAQAMADTPAGWADAPDVSGFEFIVVLFLIPAGLALVIAILAALPSVIGDRGYEPGQAWRSEPEWFGGPRGGLKGDSDAPEAIEEGQGGSSARW